ncbi:MAG: hypothetical protein WKF97_16285 [Chitinophagaceae bacterium]
MITTTLKLSTFLVFTSTLSFLSCNKTDLPTIPRCDVAEYIVGEPYFFGYPYLFAKKYDHTGKIIKEITCTFENIVRPDLMPVFNLVIKQKGLNVFLLNKNNLLDTALKVLLNHNGKVIWSEASYDLIQQNNYYRSSLFNRYTYKDNRLFSVESNYTDTSGRGLIDTLLYDSRGNILKVGSSSYEYDVSINVKKQFYILTDYMNSQNGFFLLQYLGFFPEVTNPANLLTNYTSGWGRREVFDHTFDASGNLISYRSRRMYDKVGIAVYTKWNCN